MANRFSRLKSAWNAFFNKDPTEEYIRREELIDGYSSSYRPYVYRQNRYNDKTIVISVFNRIAMDVATVNIHHVMLDDNNRFIKIREDSSLEYCLNTEANIDQTGRAFIQDLVLSMLDTGVVAAVPVDTTIDPTVTDSYQINTLRVGYITKWFPGAVTVNLYNDQTGRREEVTLPKKIVAIIENPLYSVINEPNSILKRLMHKLALLDMVDEQNSSGKLDLIIQLPYVIKTEARRQQAENRRKDIENQLEGSKYGIAYTDGTERITQLNRSVENNLSAQVEYLTSMLYASLGITTEIMNGTADERAMSNYYERTIEPIISAIVDEMKRKFLTQTARSQKQSIQFFRDPFKLVPVSEIAEIADKFTRNEIMTSNEFRQVVGMVPSSDPEADELRNKNLSKPSGEEEPTPVLNNNDKIELERGENQNG